MDSRLNQAVTEIKSGNREKGKNILIQILREDRNNENAWLWMSQCVDTTTDKEKCFRQVLAINPANEHAQKALQELAPSSFLDELNIPVRNNVKPNDSNKAIKPKAEKKPKKKSLLRKIWFPLMLALIGCVGSVVAAFVGSENLAKFFPSFHPVSGEFTISIRVTDNQGSGINGAKALFFYPAGSLSQYTDSNGVASFSVSDAGQGNLRIIVEADNYQIFEKQVLYPIETSLNIRLEKPQDTNENIILRTVSDGSNTPVAGIDVAILYNGNIYRQTTDSDGFALLTLPFPNDGEIDTQISVNAQGYDIKNQFSTLTPGKLQYVLLTPQSLTVSIPNIPLSPFSTTSTASNNIESSDKDVVGSGVVISKLEGSGLKIVFLTPDSQPWKDAYLKVYQQDMDVNGNPVRGNHVESGYINAQGELTFGLNDGKYVICPSSGSGYGWTEAGCVYDVEVTNSYLTEVRFQVGQIEFAIVDANGQPWSGVYCKIYTQDYDVSGNYVVSENVDNAYTDNTGAMKMWLTPGVYSINVNLDGYNWGMLSDRKGDANLVVRKGETTSLLIEMGQLSLGLRNSDGTPQTGTYIKVYTQRADINNNPIVDDNIWNGYTDNGGFAFVNLTEGLYAIKIGDNILYNVPVNWGKVTQSDGITFQQLE